jgi:hypothetical protein
LGICLGLVPCLSRLGGGGEAEEEDEDGDEPDDRARARPAGGVPGGAGTVVGGAANLDCVMSKVESIKGKAECWYTCPSGRSEQSGGGTTYVLTPPPPSPE